MTINNVRSEESNSIRAAVIRTLFHILHWVEELMSALFLRDLLFHHRRNQNSMNDTSVEASQHPLAVTTFVEAGAVGIKLYEGLVESCEPLNVVVAKDTGSSVTLSPAGSVDSGVALDDDEPMSPGVRCRSMSECGQPPLVGILKRTQPALRAKTYSEGDASRLPSLEEDLTSITSASSIEDLDENRLAKRVSFSARLESVRLFKAGSSITASAKRNEKKRNQKKRKEMERRASQDSLESLSDIPHSENNIAEVHQSLLAVR